MSGFEQAETEEWCSVTRKNVTLTLQLEAKPHGRLIAGKPVACNGNGELKDCNPKMIRCHLNDVRIETVRKR